MAPSRPYWKGYLKLSLVSCPDCALHRIVFERARLVPSNQQENRQSAAAATR